MLAVLFHWSGLGSLSDNHSPPERASEVWRLSWPQLSCKAFVRSFCDPILLFQVIVWIITRQHINQFLTYSSTLINCFFLITNLINWLYFLIIKCYKCAKNFDWNNAGFIPNPGLKQIGFSEQSGQACVLQGCGKTHASANPKLI